MKNINFVFIAFLLLSNYNLSFAQSSYTTEKGDVHLLGDVDLQALSQAPYVDWFTEYQEDFEPSISADLGENLKDATVKIYIGTWCGDTKYLLPKFIKTWKHLGLKEDQLEIVALHRSGKEYKRSPERTEEKYNIHRVPTFVFEKDDKEIGRIVERPVNDLDTDIAQIALGFPSQPRYQAVAILNNHFQTHKDSLHSDFKSTLNKMYRNVSGPGELNTYGYVLMAAEKYDLAELAFKANARIFPFDPNVHDSLGELYIELEKYNEAKGCFERVLNIKNEDERASEMLTTVEEKLNN